MCSVESLRVVLWSFLSLNLLDSWVRNSLKESALQKPSLPIGYGLLSGYSIFPWLRSGCRSGFVRFGLLLLVGLGLGYCSVSSFDRSWGFWLGCWCAPVTPRLMLKTNWCWLWRFRCSIYRYCIAVLVILVFAPYSSLWAFVLLGVIDSLSLSKSSVGAILGLLLSAVRCAKAWCLLW